MISVVIPLYNKETFISETIQSVLNQTYTDYELVIVNDGSTDNSIEKVEQFDDPRIQLLSIPNSGVSVARNTGIKMAKMKWIAFLDADDYWSSSFLMEMVTAIKKYSKDRIFASGRSRVFRTNIERYENKFLPKEGETDRLNYFKIIRKNLPLINSSNVVLEKTLFDEYGYFRVGQQKHEDHDLWMRLCVDNLVVFVNKPLSFYRKTEINTSSQAIYSANDFKMFLETMIYVKDKLTLQERNDFKAYADRYILLTFIKYHYNYSRSEKMELCELAQNIISKKHIMLLRLVKLLPFDIYYILAKMTTLWKKGK